jgi:hypothetical protein
LLSKDLGKYNKNIGVLFDTGCYNTVIDYAIAEMYGVSLEHKVPIVIGGVSGEATLFVLHEFVIGGMAMSDVLVQAYKFPEGNSFKDMIILGTNIINNWDFTISGAPRRLTVKENIRDVPNSAHPYRNYFDGAGKYVNTQDSFFAGKGNNVKGDFNVN